MKVAQFTTTKDSGGAESLILSLTQQLLERNIYTTLYAFDNSWIKRRANELRLPVYSLGKSFEEKISVYKIPQFGWKFADIMKLHNIDVLHSHTFKATLRGAATSFFRGIPHVATQHDNYTIEDKPSRARWLNIAGRLGTNIVLISKQMKNLYQQYGVNSKYCSLIHNGVDTNRFIPYNTSDIREFIRHQYNISQNDFVFIYVGRLERIKGLDNLLKAKAKYKLPCRLFLVGDGSERLSLEKQAKKLGIQKDVIFAGEQFKVEDWLNAADGFVLPSHSEGLSCSIIEAMACGLPIIATNVGGNPDLVEHTANGFLVEPNNSDKLAECMASMINSYNNHKPLFNKMCKISRDKALDFSLEKMVDQYVDLYYSLTER